MLCKIRTLKFIARVSSGLIPGLRAAFEREGHLAVHHVRVSRGGSDIGVVQHPLYEFEVAGLAKQLRRPVVAVVM